MQCTIFTFTYSLLSHQYSYFFTHSILWKFKVWFKKVYTGFHFFFKNILLYKLKIAPSKIYQMFWNQKYICWNVYFQLRNFIHLRLHHACSGFSHSNFSCIYICLLARSNCCQFLNSFCCIFHNTYLVLFIKKKQNSLTIINPKNNSSSDML